MRERLNGEHGLGAIFPAMANSVMMFDVLGIPPDDPDRAVARRSIDKLLVIHGDEAYCQPCVSPVWDTALAAHALLEASEPRATAAVKRALDWLRPLQVLDVRGDWTVRRPHVRPGGWAFQYANDHYPDVDDTAVVAAAMHRAAHADHAGRADPNAEAVARAIEWIVGMQSGNGGWGAFEPENTHLYLNNIPFADHGALLDPPTADVSARCLSMLCQTGATPDVSEPAARALQYLLAEQMPDGSWFGRWGTNYIYGTWSALCALNAAALGAEAPPVRRAAEWLIAIQNPDGGWGEDGDSYKLEYRGYERAPSVASQTAWALLALMAAGQAAHPAVARGVDYLLRTQGARRPVARAALHRRGIPARVLPALSRLCALFPAVGAGALPQPAARRRSPRGVGTVSGTPDARAMSKPCVLVVCGMDFEARIAAGPHCEVVVGQRGAALGAAIERSAGTCAAIISFGVAGGLDPSLAPAR